MSTRPSSNVSPEQLWRYFKPRLSYLSGDDPIAALHEASAFRDVLAPYLIETLEALTQDPAPTLAVDYVLHLHALALLAEWRDTRAYRVAVAFSHQPEAMADDVFGFFTSEMLNRCLASVFDGDLQPLILLAEDVKVDKWIRLAALEAMSICAIHGAADTQVVVQAIVKSAEQEAARLEAMPERDIDEAGWLQCHAHQLADLGAVDCLPLIQIWYQKELLDHSLAPIEELELDMHLPQPERLIVMNETNRGYVINAAEAMLHLFGATHDEVEEEPYIRQVPKVGRNDPCPCGSGLKFKKCCGANL